MLAELKSWTHSSSSQWDAPPSSLVFDSSGVRWLLRGDHQSGCVLSKCNLIAQNPVFEMWSEAASPTLALVWAPLLGSPCSDWVKDFPNADLVTPKLSLEALLPCFPMAFVVWKCTFLRVSLMVSYSTDKWLQEWPGLLQFFYIILFYSFIHSCTHLGYVPVTACYGTHVGVREQLDRADCLILPHESQSSKACHQDWQASSFVHWVISLAQVLDSLYWKQRQHSLINQHSWRSRKSRKKSFVLV